MKRSKAVLLAVVLLVAATVNMFTGCDRQPDAGTFKLFFENTETYIKDVSKIFRHERVIDGGDKNFEKVKYEFSDKSAAMCSERHDRTVQSYYVLDGEILKSYSKEDTIDPQKVVTEGTWYVNHQVPNGNEFTTLREEASQNFPFIAALKDSFDMFERRDDAYFVMEDKLEEAELLYNASTSHFSEIKYTFKNEKVASLEVKFTQYNVDYTASFKYDYTNFKVTVPQKALEAEIEEYGEENIFTLSYQKSFNQIFNSSSPVKINVSTTQDGVSLGNESYEYSGNIIKFYTINYNLGGIETKYSLFESGFFTSYTKNDTINSQKVVVDGVWTKYKASSTEYDFKNQLNTSGFYYYLMTYVQPFRKKMRLFENKNNAYFVKSENLASATALVEPQQFVLKEVKITFDANYITSFSMKYNYTEAYIGYLTELFKNMGLEFNGSSNFVYETVITFSFSAFTITIPQAALTAN